MIAQSAGNSSEYPHGLKLRQSSYHDDKSTWQCFTRAFSPQLIRNVRSRRRIDSSSIIAHPVNLRWGRSLMPRTRHIYVYDALANRYGFSISVQPEIDCTTFHSFFSWNVWKKKKKFFKIFKSWQVCDWLAKWISMLGFMDLRWPRVFRRSSVGLVFKLESSNFAHFKILSGCLT